MHSNTIRNTSFQPSNVSPEFAEWLANEKDDAVRHQRRIFKATLLLAVAIVLFVLKDNSQLIAGLLNLDAYAAN
ncbi:MAG: hypothetical protein IT258_05010 [Saprospiraceae bacterium]|nr:hypothetical protein [Saprospiraceae bacterium]